MDYDKLHRTKLITLAEDGHWKRGLVLRPYFEGEPTEEKLTLFHVGRQVFGKYEFFNIRQYFTVELKKSKMEPIKEYFLYEGELYNLIQFSEEALPVVPKKQGVYHRPNKKKKEV